MKPHRCTRFKQTGMMRMLAANLSVSVNGQKREQSMSADMVELKCIRCGATQWYERARVDDEGKYLRLKESGL